MPKKKNKAGQDQEYVPSGNGDASGEYADDGGSNRHFVSFKKPVEEIKKEVDDTKNVFKTTTKKGRFRFNEYWNKWDYYTDEEYDKYLKQKANAEQWGYTGYQKDKWKELDIKTLDPEDVKNLASKSEQEIISRIDKMSIEDLNKYNESKITNQWITDVLGKDFSEEEVNAFIKENRKEFTMDTSKIREAFKNREITVAKEYIDKNFSKIKGKHTIEDDLKAANPNYNTAYKYQINCQRCSYVYELRRRGYDVEAYPNDDDYGRKRGSFWTNQMVNSEKYSFANKMGARKLNEKISQKVLEAGDGARFAVEVQWRRSRSGHLFIVENVGGEVRYLDAQMGNTNAITYLNDVATSKETVIMRMDNADFGKGVVMTGFSKGKEKTDE